MDPAVKIEKLQAMRRYRSLQSRFLLNLVQYCLSLLCFGLFLSCPLWLPKLFAAVRYLLFVFVPGVGAHLFCPKCFFLLGNAIVIFLVGESKLSAHGTAASTAPDIYDEYVERSKGAAGRRMSPGGGRKEKVDEEVLLQRPASDDGFKEEVIAPPVNVKAQEEEEEEEAEGGGEEEGWDGWEEEEEEEYYGGDECLEMMETTTQGEEDDEELPDEELNRRIEDFIARVNKQRRLEQLGWSG